MNYCIRNARILDPVTGDDSLCDVSVKLGKIETVVPASGLVTDTDLDLKGDWLFPGFIDYHVHLFAHGSTFGMDADRLLEAGVTTAVDMGSAGWVNYPAMRECDLVSKKLTLKTYLNISPVGQPGRGINEPLDDAVVSLESIQKIADNYPGEILGVKVRISKPIVRELGLAPLKRAVEIGEALDLPVCVHTTNPPESAVETVKILRPGDVYSHTYHGSGNTIIGPDGHVYPEVLEAQKNGLIMEVGNGTKNFNFKVAQQAIADGLLPDIISSDATPNSFRTNKAMWDLPYVMSKFLNMGVPLPQVIRSVTETPAKVLGMENEIGAIAPGMYADFAVCRLEDTNPLFGDSDGNELQGKTEIRVQRTIYHGYTMYTTD